MYQSEFTDLLLGSLGGGVADAAGADGLGRALVLDRLVIVRRLGGRYHGMRAAVAGGAG